jgi:hypothetical protein
MHATPPPPTAAELSSYMNKPAYVAEHEQAPLEDMLAEKGLSVSLDNGTPVILAYAPQDKGGQQPIINPSKIIRMRMSGNFRLINLANKLENGESLSPSEYSAALSLIGISSPNTPDKQAVLDYFSSSPLDTINAKISDMSLEQKVNVYKNLADFEQRKSGMDASKVIDYYRQLIKLEPDNFEHYRALYKFVRGPPGHKTDNITWEEMAQYTQRAAELAPDVDTKIGYLFESADYLLLQNGEEKNKKYITQIDKLLNEIISLAPLSKKKEVYLEDARRAKRIYIK